jgi:holo-[acyl-carrier protein] synthase
MRLTGGALQRLMEITPPGMKGHINVTITDDYPLAQALVIITALAEPPQESGNS